MIPTELKANWLTRENEELIEKRRRRYFHFDAIIEKITLTIFRKVTNPNYIARHAFLPLLKRIQKDRLYKKDATTGKKVVKPKERPISYAAHFDAIVYSWYGSQLEYYYENALARDKISDAVIAYRKLGRSNLNFAREVFTYIEQQNSCVAIAVDITGFYDSLDHRRLKSAWTKLLNRKDLPPDHYQVFKSVTRAASARIDKVQKILGIGERGAKKMRLFLGIDLLEQLRAEDCIETNKLGKGIPQGTPISCVLSNAYMRDFDVAISRDVKERGGIYRRYSDDIMIVCPSEMKEKIMEILIKEIANVKLEIQPAKTEVRFFRKNAEGFLSCTNEYGKSAILQYLGVIFDGKRMTLRHKGRAKFGRRMVRAIRREVYAAKELKVHVAKRKLYEQFTPMGKRNYVTYAQRAARELGTPSILKSLTMHRLVNKIKDRLRKEGE